jgi:hypothetical protein
MPDRREFLTGAVGVAVGSLVALPAPACAQAAPLAFRPSALLLEHRRLAALVLAIEAIEPLDPYYALEAAGTHLTMTTALEAELEAVTARHRARVDAHMPALASISRQIWATPAATWDDIVARAELAAFWDRHGLGYEDFHGYDDPFADMRLIDAVLAVAAAHPPPQSRTPIPPFDPPPALLEWRLLDVQRARVLAIRDWTTEEKFNNSEAQYRLEFAVLKEPATCWADIVVRAELMSWRRRSSLPGQCWSRIDVRDDGVHGNQRSLAELLTAILRLGNCPPLADVDEIGWERRARPIVEKARAKSRLYHTEVKALRKDWLALDRATA